MAEVLPRDVLFRAGGACLDRYGVAVWRKDIPSLGGEDGKEVFTRADATTCATYIDRDGTLRLAAAGKLRGDWSSGSLALLTEPTRTNLALYARDLTNAAWVKSNVSAVKDQTGIDGVASSASKITASAGNGTCLQSITSASDARFTSCYVQRVTGSGTINMTQDNGATWTAITVTSSWTRVPIPIATVVNPILGFRIVTSGDAIAVDFVQHTKGEKFDTSPIATTAAAVTRAEDRVLAPIGFGGQDFTAYCSIVRPPWADASGDIGYGPYIFTLGSGSVRASLYGAQAARNLTAEVDSGSNPQGVTQAIPGGATLDLCAQFADVLTAAKVRLDVGSGFGSYSSVTGAIPVFTGNLLGLGCAAHASSTAGAPILKLLLCRGAFTLAEMQAVPW